MSETQEVIKLPTFETHPEGGTALPTSVGWNHVQLASHLSGKTIQYTTSKPSTLTGGNRRTFKVMEVEDVFESKNTNEQCVRVYVADMDAEGAPLKYRTLHVNGIKTLT